MEREERDLKVILRNLKKTWKYAKGGKKYFAIFCIGALITVVISAVMPLISAQILIQITKSKWDALVDYAFILLILSVVFVVFRLIMQLSGNKFFRYILVNLQTSLAIETLNLESKELATNTSGLFANRINYDCNNICDIFNDLTFRILNILTSVGILFAIFVINKYVFCYFVIVIIFITILTSKRYKFYFIREKEVRKINEKNTGMVTELVRGLKDIKVLNAIIPFSNKVGERFTYSNQKKYELRKKDALMGNGIRLINNIADFGFIILGVYLITKNLLVVSSFIILYSYQAKVYNFLEELTWCLQYLKDFKLSSTRIFEVVDHEKFKKEEFGTINIGKAEGHFEFKNVSFSYENEIPIINNLSFKINPNETVAFVGRSGAGKSTIFNLITKVYPVNNGEVLIDGVNINDLDRDSIRGNVSLINQDPYIFNFSIKENLSLVKRNMTEEEMIEACKMACIHDYIMTLPDKYDTVVGEGGITLSGGQKQRLAIARALIRKTEIILFDEATSALDNETQASIQKAINNMKGEYTILIIAHRLSTVINSDRLLVIDNGKIVGEGSHEELLKNNEIYNTLYNTELK